MGMRKTARPRGGQGGTIVLGLKAQHVVAFMHDTAHRYGFECSGESHAPLLALTAQSLNFASVLQAHARNSDAPCNSQLTEEATSQKEQPLAAGLRCVLFACPVYEDHPSPSTDTISGELGFRYAAVLVDQAWCTPLGDRAATRSQRQVQWERISTRLRESAEEALGILAEQITVNLASMRRFKAMYRNPQRAKQSDLQVMLDECNSHVDLSTEPLTSRAVQALKGMSSMHWPRLANHLRGQFTGKCCELSAPLGVDHTPVVARHLLLLFTVGGALRSLPHAEEKHYVLLHVSWSVDSGALDGVWLHSSKRLPATVIIPVSRPAPEDGELMVVVDELSGLSQDGIGLMNSSMLMSSFRSSATPGFASVKGPQEFNAPAVAGPTSHITVGPGSEGKELELLVRRFITILVEFAMRDTGW